MSVRRLILLCLAANVPALAAPRAEEANLPLVRISRWVSNWALADLNGDHQIDVVTVQPGRSGSQGYDHQVEIRFGGAAEKSYFTFRDHSRNVSVGIRDLDGDHDGDIVIQEVWSRKLLSVWLNDGSGNFHEADRADFRATASEPDAPHVEPPGLCCDFPIGSSEQRIPYTVPESSVAGPQRFFERVISEPGLIRAHGLFSHRRSRAPPLQA